MVICDDEFETKENQIEPRIQIESQHNYTVSHLSQHSDVGNVTNNENLLITDGKITMLLIKW